MEPSLSYRFRHAGAGLIEKLPAALAYRVRSFAERHAPDANCCAHAKPPIHAHWAEHHLKPRFARLGFTDALDFVAKHCIAAIAARDGRPLRIASLGAGNGAFELALADRLEHEADGGFRITLIDLDAGAIREARRAAKRRGLAHRFSFRVADLNVAPLDAPLDVVLANQSLHHLVALEAIFDRIHGALADDGAFLVADVIGRNHHRLWPEAEEALAPWFAALPARCRHDRALGATVDRYANVDAPILAFEGVRAQDVLPLLASRFHAETFAPYGGLATALVDPRYGYGLDPDRAEDRAFVARLAEREHALLESGEIKPTHLVASFRKHPTALRTLHPNLTPERCIRRP